MVWSSRLHEHLEGSNFCIYLNDATLVMDVKGSSSHRRFSKKKDVLKNFAIFTGKHLCQSLFFKVIKKETLAQVVSCEFCKIFKNTFFTEHLWTTASERSSKSTRL